MPFDLLWVLSAIWILVTAIWMVPAIGAKGAGEAATGFGELRELAACRYLLKAIEERVQGDPCGPGGPPYRLRIHSMIAASTQKR
jgi:hypothetical protein